VKRFRQNRSIGTFLINICLLNSLTVMLRMAPVFVLASCSVLQPTASVHIFSVERDKPFETSDTLAVLIGIDSETDFVFDINGSNQIHSSSGEKTFLAEKIRTGWYYADIIGNEMWVRGMPIYLKGGGSTYIQFLKTGVYVNYKPFFKVEIDKSIYNPFAPVLTVGCFGCNGAPDFQIDHVRVNPIQPYIPLSADWHSIEIYSPADNIQIYYRALFSNYSITRFTLYPVENF